MEAIVFEGVDLSGTENLWTDGVNLTAADVNSRNENSLF